MKLVTQVLQCIPGCADLHTFLRVTVSEHITGFIAMALEESIEQTLHIARSVSLYRIPPRGPTGHVSGDWRVSDRRERWPAAALHALT